jgi:RNA polymerase sigma factor (TIGR02999 family)
MQESIRETPDAFDAAAVTRLLNDARDDPARAEALLPLVYQQLRRLAARKMRGERADATLGATALVHEAYLRLVEQRGGGGPRWDGRWHFFAAAAEAMRRILVEKARRRARLKRGGGLQRVSLDDAQLSVHEPPEDLLALDEALVKLAEQHPEKAQLVKLRYFAGLSIAEASEALGVSPATADRHWAFARAWLYRQIRSQ